jgi:hypothetical protein
MHRPPPDPDPFRDPEELPPGGDARVPPPSGGPSPPPAPDSLPARLGKVIFSPGELFRGLAAQPLLAGALILGALLLGLSNLAIPTEVFEEGLRTQTLVTGQEMPGDPAVVARVMKVGAIFGSVIVWPVVAAISAGIYALVLLFGFGFQGTYRQYLSVTAHALLIPALGAVLLVPLKIMTEDPAFSLSLGSLVFFLEEGYPARFLSYLDLFGLWSYVLVGLGAAIVDGTRSPRTAISVTVGLAVLVAAVVAAFTG